MMEINIKDKIPNERVLERIGVIYMVEQMATFKSNWAEHIKRTK